MPGIPSLVATGTKVWIDSVDPDEIATFEPKGATGATSNPIIIADLIKTGRFDDNFREFLEADSSLTDDDLAWAMTDFLVSKAQEVFKPTWASTECNDGWVSFELDPLLEDPENKTPVAERSAKYVELGLKWNQIAKDKGIANRMIKVPATEAGLGALEELAANGITLNVTLIFSPRQYIAARDAIWRGAQRRSDGLDTFKSVYSIFVSRVDVYTEKQVSELSDDAQGMVGIVNAKQIYEMNKTFWADKGLKLQQEMIFASTGTKKPEDPKDKYVAALCGADIQTNPPATNQYVAESGTEFTSQIDIPVPDALASEIAEKVDMDQLEVTLMSEGVQKFADPHKALIDLISSKRGQLASV